MDHVENREWAIFETIRGDFFWLLDLSQIETISIITWYTTLKMSIFSIIYSHSTENRKKVENFGRRNIFFFSLILRALCCGQKEKLYFFRVWVAKYFGEFFNAITTHLIYVYTMDRSCSKSVTKSQKKIRNPPQI